MGTPSTIADEIQAWFEADACDGFTVMFPYVPEGLDVFVDGVVPELQRGGLLRTRTRVAHRVRTWAWRDHQTPSFNRPELVFDACVFRAG